MRTMGNCTCPFVNNLHFEPFMLVCGCIIYICGLVLIAVSGYTFHQHHTHITVNTDASKYLAHPHSSTVTLAIIYPTFLVSICIYTAVALRRIVESKSGRYSTFNLLQLNLLICILLMSPHS